MKSKTKLKITLVERRPKPAPWDDAVWLDETVRNPRNIYCALDSIGIRNRQQFTDDLTGAMHRVAVAYPQDFVHIEGLYRPRSKRWAASHGSMRTALSDWIRKITRVEVESKIIDAKVPLYIFNCPEVANAKATLSESEETEAGGGWKIEIVGNSLGEDVTFTVSQTDTFGAKTGQRKMVFAPVKIRVAKMAVLKKGVFQEHVLKAEADDSTAGATPKGVRLVPIDEWRKHVEGGVLEREFDLSEDDEDPPEKFERTLKMSGTIEASFGFKAFDISSSVTTKCTASETVSMSLELPGRNKYVLKRPASIKGFYFD